MILQCSQRYTEGRAGRAKEEWSQAEGTSRGSVSLRAKEQQDDSQQSRAGQGGAQHSTSAQSSNIAQALQ